MSTGQTKTTAVATKAEAALLAIQDEFAGMGFEGTTAKDLAIPFISILQSNSPQVEDDSPKGSKPGMLYNTVTQELIPGSQGFVFQPVYLEDTFVEWVPRDSGGGFVAAHDANSEVVKAAEAARGTDRTKKLLMSNGNELIQTSYAYGLILDKDGKETTGFTVISFTSTKLKVFRKWRTALFMIKGRPALFKHRAVISTVKEKNDKGSFYNFHISPLLENNWLKSMLDVEDEAQYALVREGYEFRQMVVSGMARAVFETQNSTGDAGNGPSEDIPF
jgi:hypothetical protein